MVIAMAMVLVITVIRLARSAALGRVVIVVVGLLLGHGLRTCPVNTRWFERRMTSQPE